jgi:hypothetical protein
MFSKRSQILSVFQNYGVLEFHWEKSLLLLKAKNGKGTLFQAEILMNNLKNGSFLFLCILYFIL